jgi:hypothetical protein
MALDTYANLQTAIANWIWRTGETATVAAIPDMITMAEAYFNRVLRCDDMDAVSATLAFTDGVASVPTGFRQMKSVRLVADPGGRLTYRPMDYIENLDDDATQDPVYWTRVGSEFHIWPRKTVTLRVRYREAIPALTGSNPSNWLLAKHPDLYLNCACSMGEQYVMNDPRIAIWKAETMRIIGEINGEDFLIAGDGLEVAPSVGTVI